MTKSNYTGQISLPKPWKYYYREEDGTDYEVTNQLELDVALLTNIAHNLKSF